jgi:hypothetical protein
MRRTFGKNRISRGLIRHRSSAAESGANVFKMAEVSRHRSLDTLRDYVRRIDLFKERRSREAESW